MDDMAPTYEERGDGDDPIRLLAIRDTPLSVDEVLGAVGDDAAGGTTLFVGTVRDHDGRPDAAVTGLSYSAHPTAGAELRRVAEKVAADFPVRALAAVHRVGDLRVGDIAVVVAVACPHRGEAFRGEPPADRRPEGPGSDLEAPDLRRRPRGLGRRVGAPIAPTWPRSRGRGPL